MAGVITGAEAEAMIFVDDEPVPGFDWGGLLTGFTEGATGAMEVYGKWLKLEAQQDANEIRNQLARFRLQQGMTGKAPAGFGGINWLTILAFGGVSILAIFLLSRTF